MPMEIGNGPANERATADVLVVVGVTRRAQPLTQWAALVPLLARCLGACGFSLAHAEQDRNDSRCGDAKAAPCPGFEARTVHNLLLAPSAKREVGSREPSGVSRTLHLAPDTSPYHSIGPSPYHLANRAAAEDLVPAIEDECLTGGGD